MKLYTRTGDDGTTGLFGGARVGKAHPRVAAYGDVDELNAAVGLAAFAAGRAGTEGSLPAGFAAAIHDMLADLQSRLFDLGADLATPDDSPHAAKIARMSARHVAEVEARIDEIDGGNEPMRSFVLPGGTDLAARLHFARAVCRRAERSMVELARAAPVNAHALVYANRVSDLLFALARRANREAGVKDVPWTGARSG